jgi:hypothetical protein
VVHSSVSYHQEHALPQPATVTHDGVAYGGVVCTYARSFQSVKGIHLCMKSAIWNVVRRVVSWGWMVCCNLVVVVA